MVFVLVPVDMFAKSTDQLIQLMLTCLAPLGALSPFVVWPLIKGPIRLSKFGQIGIKVSLAISSALGLIFGTIAAFKGVGPDAVLFWLSLTTAFVASWILYLIFVNACSLTPVSEE